MNNYIFYVFAILVFLYICYKQCEFQYNIWFSQKESFTPLQVNQIIQEPGSGEIGTTDPEYFHESQILTASNGYNEKTINSLKPDNPEPMQKKLYDDDFGDFPQDVEKKYELPTTEFEFPNNYNFTVKYPCRKTSTGMFTDCGVWSANTGWTANPYKGLSCPIENGKTPNIPPSQENTREMQNIHSYQRKTGINSIGNSMLR